MLTMGEAGGGIFVISKVSVQLPCASGFIPKLKFIFEKRKQKHVSAKIKAFVKKGGKDE